MTRKNTFAAAGTILVLAAWLIIGCSSGDPRQVPPVLPLCTYGTDGQSCNVLVWGLYEIEYEPGSGQVVVMPLRDAGFTVNVLKFLQGMPPLVKVSNLDLGKWPEQGILSMDITITHPFTGNQMTGFDVMGVVMGHGSLISKMDTGIKYTGPNETTLLNSDGYTRWMNPEEFGTPGIFGFTEGNLGPKGIAWTATINGYKYFADSLQAEEEVKDYYSDPTHMDGRGAFLPSTTNTRRYEIQFPVEGGKPKLRFQYAVIAHWDKDTESLAANCQEAFYMNCDASESSTWYYGPTQNGGDIILWLTVYDWQGKDDPMGVVGQISELWIESATTMIGSPGATFTQANLQDSVIGSGLNWVTFLLTVPDVHPTKDEWEDILITIQTDSDTPTSYAPPVPGAPPPEYSAGHLAAYARVQVPVSPCQAPEGLFVLAEDQGGDDSHSGEWGYPVAHLSYALQKAKDGGFTAIYVAENDEDDDYTESGTLTLVDGISIFGGCDSEQCYAQKVGVRSVIPFTSQNMIGAVYGKNITSDTTISQMEFHAAPGTSDALNSTTVYLDSCTAGLRFVDCWFQSYEGAQGADGENGSPGSSGQDGTNGDPGCRHDPPNGGWECEQPAPGIGGGSGPSKAGDGGHPGWGESVLAKGEDGKSSYCGNGGGLGGGYGEDGEPGSAGADGTEGAPGSGGNGQGSVVGKIWCTSPGSNGDVGGPGCGGGGGGGGGGGWDWYIGDNPRTYGGGGGGGAGGGNGGEEGKGGGGGGGAFCCFLFNSSPSFESCTFYSGTGGAGGDGGFGGDGGPPGAPGNGGAGWPNTYYPEGQDSGDGGLGGYGGYGASGGHGGGAGGGISYCVYRYLGSNPTIDPDCILMPGEGGAGGGAPPGGNPGEIGDSGDIY